VEGFKDEVDITLHYSHFLLYILKFMFYKMVTISCFVMIEKSSGTRQQGQRDTFIQPVRNLEIT